MFRHRAQRRDEMTTKIWGWGIVLSALAIGCVCPQAQPALATNTPISLLCESRRLEGESGTKKVCWQAGPDETPQPGQEQLSLVCESRSAAGQGTQVCRRAEDFHCEDRTVTGTRIPKKVCQTQRQRKLRALDDQMEFERLLRMTSPQ